MTARVKFDTHTGTEVLRVEIFNELDGQRSDAEFHKFPVRIGRNRKNDLVLLHEYVSSWHATIGFVGGRLGIVQVGKSNSARVNGRKLHHNELATLEGTEEIRLVPFTIKLAISAQDAPAPQVDAPSHQVDVPFPPDGPFPPPGQAPLNLAAQGPLPTPEGYDPDPYQTAIPPMTGPGMQPGMGAGGPQQHLDSTGPQERLDPIETHRGHSSGQEAHHQQYQQPHPGGAYQDGTPLGSDGSVVLNRISEKYFGQPLGSAQDAEALGARLEWLFGRLLDGFVSLRNGQLEFIQKMRVNYQDDNILNQLEKAEPLGGALLSGQDQRTDPDLHRTMERLKLHQLALLRGMEAGVTDILEQLSPRAVMAQAQSNNPRALWDYYQRVHMDTEDVQECYKILYGESFRQAYAKQLQTKTKKKKTG